MQNTTFDNPWKTIIETYFEDFFLVPKFKPRTQTSFGYALG